MKTKNILKIGVFSIVLFALLISPVLNLYPQKASANGPINLIDSIEQATGGVPWEEIKARIPESQAEKWCDEIYGEEQWKIAEPFASFKNWWSHKFCVMQLSVIEGLGATISALTQSLIGYIVWALNPVTYGGFVNNTAVQDIWNVLRNFMNLALVLILVFIAIATILGIKKYRWQETLWKLLIVALLINFSLIIPGIILDTSHLITFTFLNLAKVDNLNVANSMMKALSMEEFARADKYKLSMIDDITASYDSATKETTVEATGWGLGMGKSMITAAFLLLIGIFVIIALVAIFFTMIFRAFMIIALLCVAPIAFASWVLPNTAGLWKTWWHHFLKWYTFAIIFALMLYIGIYIMNGIELGTAGLAEKDIKIGLIATVVQMVLFSMFLVGGLIFSIQGGGAFSKIVMQQASKAGVAIGGFVGKKTSGTVKESTAYKKAGKFLTKIPLLGGIGQEMMIAGEKAKAARIKEHEKDLENVSLGSLKQLEKAPLPSPLDRNAYERRVALTNKLADMGEMSKESIEFTKMHRGDIRFKKDAIAKAVPHYFKIQDGQLVETGDTIENKVEALSRIKPDKIRDKTQTSDFIKDIVKEKEDEARKQGKSAQEIKDAGDKAFNETIQKIVKKLSPAQLAGWWQGISPKDMVEGKWGGPEGKIAQAIKKDEQARKKFYEEAIPSSTVLRAASGITSEGPKETPPSEGLDE